MKDDREGGVHFARTETIFNISAKLFFSDSANVLPAKIRRDFDANEFPISNFDNFSCESFKALWILVLIFSRVHENEFSILCNCGCVNIFYEK